MQPVLANSPPVTAVGCGPNNPPVVAVVVVVPESITHLNISASAHLTQLQFVTTFGFSLKVDVNEGRKEGQFRASKLW